LQPEIVFRLGTRRLGLPLGQVREVVLPGPLSRVPRAAPGICGVMNVRGRVVLIADGGLLLGGIASQVGASSERILILDPRRRNLGIWVSEVVSIAQLGEEASFAPARESLLDAEELASRVAQLFGL
jgi:purine-binding chemotaxis protein CheW